MCLQEARVKIKVKDGLEHLALWAKLLLLLQVFLSLTIIFNWIGFNFVLKFPEKQLETTVGQYFPIEMKKKK